jgi:LuxR family maltose regulon positive regulatory protein
MALLLEEAAKHTIAPDYTSRLLAAFGEGQGQDRSYDHEQDSKPGKQVLPEPLSERELEVLRLLGSDLSGPEIAGALMVSLNTMHTHTKNIYPKLGVNNRRAAVRRAEELHLL